MIPWLCCFGTCYEAEHYDGELVKNQSYSPYGKREFKGAEKEEEGGGIARWCAHHQWFNIPLLGSSDTHTVSITFRYHHSLTTKPCIQITDAGSRCSMFLAPLSSQGLHQGFSSHHCIHYAISNFYPLFTVVFPNLFWNLNGSLHDPITLTFSMLQKQYYVDSY